MSLMLPGKFVIRNSIYVKLLAQFIPTSMCSKKKIAPFFPLNNQVESISLFQNKREMN